MWAIVSLPNRKQWLMIHDLIVMIKWSKRILTITERLAVKMKTCSPLYCTKVILIIDLIFDTCSTEYARQASYMFNVCIKWPIFILKSVSRIRNSWSDCILNVYRFIHQFIKYIVINDLPDLLSKRIEAEKKWHNFPVRNFWNENMGISGVGVGVGVYLYQ